MLWCDSHNGKMEGLMMNNVLEWKERKFLHLASSEVTRMSPKELKEAMDATDTLRFKLVAELARRIEKKKQEESENDV